MSLAIEVTGAEGRGISLVIVRNYRRDTFMSVFGLRAGRFGFAIKSDKGVNYLSVLVAISR
jgi:hypothetical protein